MLGNKARCYPQVEEEQRAVMRKHGSALDYDILQEMDVLHRTIKEALRMHPPLVMLMRFAKEAFDVTTSTGETYHVPQGHVCAVSPTFAHTLEEIFPRADYFDPDRFAPPREEDKKKPASFIGFGYGRHGCMGEIFAYMQIKTIWSILIRNFDFEMVDAIPQPDWEAMVIGPKPCRVKFTRRKLSA
jgi:sterol 14alpha-demethylase